MNKISLGVLACLVLVIGACAVFYFFRAPLAQQPALQPPLPAPAAAVRRFEPCCEQPQPTVPQQATPALEASPTKPTVASR